ncbi:MAG: Transporter, sodium/sulfate symporter family [Olavius algarvensis Gamma 3 endosymbiont]|nr:MAG: Transporter, sodium/sulfate symporter family [Olavius algarvensis Gamma 3 endosymbiont]
MSRLSRTLRVRLKKVRLKKLRSIKWLAGIIFVVLGWYVTGLAPSNDIAWVTGLLFFTVYLFIFEIVKVDEAAVTIMVLLGLSSLLAPAMGIKQGLVNTHHLFDGFASNAVMSIIAVMIIGAGLDKTGLMSKVAAYILKVGGSSEGRIIPIVSGTVGIISSFMQNVGAAALFLPVVSRISARSGLPMSRLLMPMGFTAILGGTVTMVGSSPLILLNDLILTSNQALPIYQQMRTYDLFAVTPVGLALVATGVIYFVLAGRFVLPKTSAEASTAAAGSSKYLEEVYGIDYMTFEVNVPEGSPLVGQVLHDIESINKIRVIAVKAADTGVRASCGDLSRDVDIGPASALGILCSPEHLKDFVDKYGLTIQKGLRVFSEVLSSAQTGIAEIVIPPGSTLIGKSAQDVWMRKSYGIAMVGLHRDGETMVEGEHIREIPLEAGDTILAHTTWRALAHLERDRNFVIVTSEYPREETRPNKVGWATFFFSLALSMVLFTDLRLSVALMSGAVGMILSGVLKIEEAYEAVSWSTVFLLASLIPLGLAVETSGTAKWIAEQTLLVVGDMPIWVIQAAVALLATFFTLVMSNVGATVLLVPLAVNIAIGAGASPAVFALTVALATSNSFLIPTHQVNALIQGPGGYRVPDFMRAGGIMSILFIIVMLVTMNLVF